MGSLIAPLMADVFMNWLIDNFNKIGCSYQIICRYVDDIFCMFDSKEKMDQFFYNKQSAFKRKLFKRGGSRQTAGIFGCLIDNN